MNPLLFLLHKKISHMLFADAEAKSLLVGICCCALLKTKRPTIFGFSLIIKYLPLMPNSKRDTIPARPYPDRCFNFHAWKCRQFFGKTEYSCTSVIWWGINSLDCMVWSKHFWLSNSPDLNWLDNFASRVIEQHRYFTRQATIEPSFADIYMYKL